MHEIRLTGEALEAQRFQAAIDRMAAAGGGRLIVPAGRWTVGDAALRSGVTLQLASGCVLDGALTATDADDVHVLGEGPDASTVAGGLRMRRVKGVECRGWAGRVVSGEHVESGRFSGLKLHQPPQRQGGGSVVWFLWSRDLYWEDCDLESNDDVFCLKRAAQNVTLVHSRLCGRMAAPYKIGTESDGLFRGIVFADCLIEKSDRAAVSLESVDGAELCDVRVERIRMEDVNAPLFIRLGRRDRYSKGLGSIHDILIADITGYGDAMDEGFGSCISGLPERPVENVVLRDIRFVSRGGQAPYPAARAVPERAELYPEFDMFGRLPAHGLYARHVRGLRLERCAWTAAQADGRPTIALEDAREVETVQTPEPHVRPPAPAPAQPPLPPGDMDRLFAAIAAARPGETVWVEPGEYAIPRERIPIRLDRPGVTVRGRMGAAQSRIRAVGAREHPKQYQRIVHPDLGREFDVLFWISADNVRLSGLTLSAAVYNVFLTEAHGCEIADCVFDFTKCHHVDAYKCRGLVIARNRSRASLTCSLKLDLCEACAIRGNTFEEDPSAVTLVGTCNSEISGNRFLAPSWHGASLCDRADRNRVSGNLFADGRLTGAQIRSSHGNEVTGNEFRGQKTESVMVDGDARENRIRNNSFHDNRGTAVSNETPHAIDAAQNWWGRPEGPRPGIDVDANVTVEPWLTAPPALAIVP